MTIGSTRRPATTRARCSRPRTRVAAGLHLRIVQVRIDSTTEKALARLRRQTGLTDSQLVRKGLELVSQSTMPGTTRRVRGIGRFASGRSDLGANKQHLSGFGRSPATYHPSRRPM